MFKIVFVCSTNGARSQIAEGLAKSILGDLAVVKSAGLNPNSHLTPALIHAMKQARIDIAGQYVKSIEEIDLDKVSLVVNLCSKEFALSSVQPNKQLNWSYEDPLKMGSTVEQINVIRAMETDLRKRIILLKNLIQKGELVSSDRNG